MKLSAKRAAKEVGKSTPTITRAIKKGKLSAIKNENGGYEIDPAELFRVYPPVKTKGNTVKGNENGNVTNNETHNVTSVLEVEIKFLREKVDDKDIQLKEKTEFIENLSKKLDKAQDTIERQTYLIEDKSKDQDNSGLILVLPLLTALLMVLIGFGVYAFAS